MRPSQFTRSLCAVVSPVTKQSPINAKSEELMLGKAELIFPSAGSSTGLPPHTRESIWTKQNWQISRCRASDKWAAPLSLVCARGGKNQDQILRIVRLDLKVEQRLQACRLVACIYTFIILNINWWEEFYPEIRRMRVFFKSSYEVWKSSRIAVGGKRGGGRWKDLGIP